MWTTGAETAGSPRLVWIMALHDLVEGIVDLWMIGGDGHPSLWTAVEKNTVVHSFSPEHVENSCRPHERAGTHHPAPVRVRRNASTRPSNAASSFMVACTFRMEWITVE